MKKFNSQKSIDFSQNPAIKYADVLLEQQENKDNLTVYDCPIFKYGTIIGSVIVIANDFEEANKILNSFDFDSEKVPSIIIAGPPLINNMGGSICNVKNQKPGIWLVRYNTHINYYYCEKTIQAATVI